MVLVGDKSTYTGITSIKIGALELTDGKVTDEIYKQKSLYFNYIYDVPFDSDFNFYISDDGKLLLEGYHGNEKVTVDVVFVNKTPGEISRRIEMIYLAENGLAVGSMPAYARFDIDLDGVEEDCTLMYMISTQSYKPYICAYEKGLLVFEGFITGDDAYRANFQTDDIYQLPPIAFTKENNTLGLVVMPQSDASVYACYYDLSYENNKIIASSNRIIID